MSVFQYYHCTPIRYILNTTDDSWGSSLCSELLSSVSSRRAPQEQESPFFRNWGFCELPECIHRISHRKYYFPSKWRQLQNRRTKYGIERFLSDYDRRNRNLIFHSLSCRYEKSHNHTTFF